MPLQKRKKAKKLPRRIRTGLAAVPVTGGFRSIEQHFRLEIQRKDCVEVMKTYFKNNYTKTEAKYLSANPDWKYTYNSATVAACWMVNCKFDLDEYGQRTLGWAKERLNELILPGKKLLEEKKLKSKDTKNVVTLTPHQRLQSKIGRTIIQDLLNLEDDWIEGKPSDIDVYSLFKMHGLAGSAVEPVRSMVEGWLLDYEDAYHARCDQAVEGYSHVKKPELNRRIKVCQNILADLDKIKSATKANRSIRIKKPKSADKQVSKMKFKKEDSNYKMVSINPVLIVGAMRVFSFNVKSKRLTELVCKHSTGFQVSGSTIKNFDPEQSKNTVLRKPEEFLPIVQNKPITKIKKAWEGLTTKNYTANGRINADTILIRVFDK